MGDAVGVQFDDLIAGQSHTFLVTRQARQHHSSCDRSVYGHLRDAALRKAFCVAVFAMMFTLVYCCDDYPQKGEVAIILNVLGQLAAGQSFPRSGDAE